MSSTPTLAGGALPTADLEVVDILQLDALHLEEEDFFGGEEEDTAGEWAEVDLRQFLAARGASGGKRRRMQVRKEMVRRRGGDCRLGM